MSVKCSFLAVNENHQNDSFRRQLAAIATISVAFSLPTIALNFLIWITIVAKRHLHRPAYVIIANLALSDWLVGCISLPCYAVVCFTQSNDNNPCFIAYITIPTSYALGLATFLIVSFQAVERFIAIFYPFVYRMRFTNSVIVTASLMIWLISCSEALFWVLSRNTLAFIIITDQVGLIFCSMYFSVITKYTLKQRR